MKRITKIVSIIFVFVICLCYLFININLTDIKAQSFDVKNASINKINENDNINDNIVYGNNNDTDMNLLYNDAITEVSELMKKLNVNNSIEALYVFEYILSNGYISIKEPNFTENEKYLLDLSDEGLLGIDVIYGNMNCRHMTDFFTKVLKNLGYDAYAMPCFITDNINEGYIMPNHVITVVNEKEVVYLDAANNIIFDKYNSEYLSDENNNYYAVAMPEYSSFDKNVVVSHNSNNEIIHINKLYNDDKTSISNKNINKEYNKIKIKIMLNKKIINKFINTYKENIINKLPDKKIYMSNV